jgi:hypothetical protein
MESNEVTMKEYNTLSEYYADVLAWERTEKLYAMLGHKPPAKPVWNPSKDYKEYG